jgi:phosphoribosylformylglycinamidine cyclo-ligase
MGVGMSIVVPAEQADKALTILRECGEDAYLIGEIARGAEKIEL